MNRYDYLDQPREVSLETLALCNAACEFCPYPTLDRKGTTMDRFMIFRLIQEMAAFKYPFYFSPFKVNEPFLDKRLVMEKPSLLEIFNELCPQGRIRLFTNGSTLTLPVIEAIAELKNVEHLWISLNSCDPDEYKQIMQLDFEKTASKLDRLHAFMWNANTAKHWMHPVIISKVADRESKNQEFITRCNTRWPSFTVKFIKRDAWLGFTDAAVSIVPNNPCARWFELSIMATGKVALCCMDGTGEYAIGDVNTQTLLEVYNSPHWFERREKFVSRKQFEPCNRCTY